MGPGITLAFVGNLSRAVCAASVIFTGILNVVDVFAAKKIAESNSTGHEETAMYIYVKQAQELTETLERRMDSMYTEKHGLEERMDKAIDLLGNNIQVLMLIHGGGSIFLQLNYPPYIGIWLSILMVVLYFSRVMVVFTVAFGKIKRMNQLVQDLLRRQIELQNDVVCLKTKIELHTNEYKANNPNNTQMELSETHGVRNGIGSLNSRVAALQKAASEILELSNFEGHQMNLLFKVAVGAIIYGISFPIISYYLLCFFNLGNGIRFLW
uniref:Uncharacterized protein n=1 Tax=Davidia involucrata TaxID=16924 RepID=A0A5B7BI77_DAVIN